ncbi:uncharacterized protein LOC144542534 [Centroberyx gerrardi]
MAAKFATKQDVRAGLDATAKLTYAPSDVCVSTNVEAKAASSASRYKMTIVIDMHSAKVEQDHTGPHPPTSAPVDPLVSTPAMKAVLGEEEESGAPEAVATLDGTKPKKTKKKGKFKAFFKRLRKALTRSFRT